MCGCYGRISSTRVFSRLLGLDDRDPSLTHRYNQPPGVFTLCAAPGRFDLSQVEMQSMHWGFIPSWAKRPGKAPINARSETAGTTTFWRKAFAARRCLVAADWWYEWTRTGKLRQPHLIRPADRQPFFLAGLWSQAKVLDPEHRAAGARTFAILTTQADQAIAHIHDRMPVALTAEGARTWLAPGDDTEELQQRLADGRHRSFETWPISRRVNSPENDDASVIEPVDNEH